MLAVIDAPNVAKTTNKPAVYLFFKQTKNQPQNIVKSKLALRSSAVTFLIINYSPPLNLAHWLTKTQTNCVKIYSIKGLLEDGVINEHADKSIVILLQTAIRGHQSHLPQIH